MESESSTPSTGRSVAPLAWFALGIVLGAAITLAAVTVRGATAPTVDMAAIRAVVRDEINTGLQNAQVQSAAASGTASAPSGASAVADSAPVSVPLNNNILGEANAPVTMIEYSDFQCPFCGRFQKDVFPQVLANYIKTGKVKLVYKHFAFLGSESTQAAVASECAADQGKFWDYHDRVFAGQRGENQGAFNTANLVKFAEELKLDKTKFQDCLTNNRTSDRVQKETAEGQKIGVRGTPHFLINGKPLVGAQPFEAFQQAIDAALKAAK